MATTAVEARGLVKRFGGPVVIDSFDMRVEQGEIYALVGPTGAGKTTVLRLIAGFSRPTAGQVVLFDGAFDPWGRLGASIGTCGLVGSLTVEQNMIAKAVSLGVVGAEEHCRELLGRVKLLSVANRKARTLLPGQRGLLGVTLALVGSPDLLLLDEPSTDLDLGEQHLASGLLEEASQDFGMTIVFAVRSPERLECRISRYGIIDHGRMLRELTADELERARTGGMRVRTSHPERTIVLLGERLPEAHMRMQPDGSLVVEGCDEGALAQVLHDGDQPVLELSLLRSDLDSFVVQVLGEGGVHD